MFIITKSSSPNHRYEVDVYGKKIKFGSPTMENFLVHKDQERKKNYLKRSSNIRNKQGKITRNYVLSPNYWSRRVLWESGEPWLGIAEKYWKHLEQEIKKIKRLEA